jgi:tetratricopeptide (TPR) repeat protein
VAEGKLKDAIEDYTIAIGLDPKDPEVYFNRGSAYMEICHYIDAIEDYTIAIGLDPASPLFYHARGCLS